MPESNTHNQLLGAQSVHKVWHCSTSHLSMDTKDYNYKIKIIKWNYERLKVFRGRWHCDSIKIKFQDSLNSRAVSTKFISLPVAINWLPDETCPEVSQEYCNNHLNVQHAILQCYIILKKMSKSEAGSLRMTKYPSKYISLLLCYHHSIRKTNHS